MLNKSVEYNQTQFLDNILKIDENLIFNHVKKEMELIEFIISEQTVTSEVIDELDMETIDNAIDVILGFNYSDPYSQENMNNPLNEMLVVNNAKNICKSMKTIRLPKDRDFF